ncbi:hypothetical protein LINPERPRIM_LOCUS5558, partial [Linum perenne]
EFDEDEFDESDYEYVGNELIHDSEESDLEVGSWISEEDKEEVEEIRKKVKTEEDNLKKKCSFFVQSQWDAYESDNFESDAIGHYEETNSYNEACRIKSLYMRYNMNTEKPNFETTMTFSSMKEVRGAIKNMLSCIKRM